MATMTPVHPPLKLQGPAGAAVVAGLLGLLLTIGPMLYLWFGVFLFASLLLILPAGLAYVAVKLIKGVKKA